MHELNKGACARNRATTVNVQYVTVSIHAQVRRPMSSLLARRVTVFALTTRGCQSSMASHAGASPHWEKLWADGLRPGSRFDVGGISRPLAAEITKRPLAPRPGMSALVPGCGRAYDAIALAEQGFDDVVALDLSPTACQAAVEEVSSSPEAKARVAVECGDFFEMEHRKFDFIWDCTFLCALEPSARERWAEQMRSLLAADGELLTCVFPIGPREGGPPFAMSVGLVRSILEPAGFEATLVRDDLPLEEQHRRPGDPVSSVQGRGSALVAWRLSGAAGPSSSRERGRVADPAAASGTGPAAASGATSEAGPLIIDTDCGLDDLATLALAASTSADLRLVTTTSGLAPHGHGHRLARRTLRRVGLGEVPVVAGAEASPLSVVREVAAWERSYGERVVTATAAMGMETAFCEAHAQREPCDAGAAATAILQTARAAGGGATVLALGALTNLAEAIAREPAEFSTLVRRVVFVADTDPETGPSAPSYNAALDPSALRAVLGSGCELVLIGRSCYPQPEWVETLFAEGRVGGASGGGAAAVLRALGRLDPHSMCYDPLALLYHLQPGAFSSTQAPVPARVSGDVCSAHGWRFERCNGAEAHGHVVEPSAVCLERYAAFLRQACA